MSIFCGEQLQEKELFDTQYTVKIKSAILEEILLVMEFTSEFTEDVTKKSINVKYGNIFLYFEKKLNLYLQK